MKKIVLISCGSKKLQQEASAQDLYIGPLFKYSLEFSRRLNPDCTFILSARHGLVELNQKLSPYNQTLNNMSMAERQLWANRAVSQLEKVSDLKTDEFVFLAGKNYRELIIPHIAKFSVPMEGLGIGEQLHYLKMASLKNYKV